MKVKVCGIRREEDRDLALALDAWALGFIFHPSSPRFISKQAAASLSRFQGAERVAVFLNPGLFEIDRVLQTGEFSMLQLHSVSENCLEEVKQEFSLPIIQVLHNFADPKFAAADFYMYEIPGADWSLLPDAGENIVSGGISKENVAAVLKRTSPFAIDLCSSLEKSYGIKDEEKMKEFFQVL